MEKNYITWDEYFMGVAELSAKRSKDPKTKVGACIINPENDHIISIGYNGLPRGMYDDGAIWDSDEKHHFVVHAEANAILNSNIENLQGMILYTTMYPCNECAKLLAQKGISKVIYKDDKFLQKESGSYAAKIFIAARIKTEKYKDEGEN